MHRTAAVLGVRNILLLLRSSPTSSIVSFRCLPFWEWRGAMREAGVCCPRLEREESMETINLGAGDGLPPVDWAAIVEKLDARSAPAPDAHNARTTWLATINEDGSPHVTAVGAVWLDGAFWFQTGRRTRKHGNVERDGRCSVAVSIRDADVVVEGHAARVTDAGTLERVANVWIEGGWPVELDESGSGVTAPFNAPTQGPPPWNVYRIEPLSAIVALGAEPGGLSRFRF